MRLISWRRLGIIASAVWVVVGPTYFHLSQEDNARRVARDRYQVCIQTSAAQPGGVERCNKDLRQALAIVQWSSWALLAFIPVALAWFMGWGLFSLISRRARSRPQAGSEQYPQIRNAEDNDEQHAKKDDFPAPWTVEAIDGGFKVIDANKQAIAYVYGHADKRDAEVTKSMTLDEARRVASNIAELPKLLGKLEQ